MNFEFIKYTQPAWQFNLKPDVPGNFPACFITEAAAKNFELDERYQTTAAKLNDLAYRLWNKGHLLKATHAEMQLQQALQPPTLQDEYIFIKKFWGASWAFFALVLRLLGFKNPVQEISCFYKTRHIRKINPHRDPVTYDDYESFASSLISMQPFVAVIIPTLNRYAYLHDVLKDLEQQHYKNFEVIIIDQSDEFNKSFYDNYELDIKVIRQKEKLLWTARNKAVTVTSADYLLFFDDDSRVQPDWIQQHLKCMDYFNADISAGVSLMHAKQNIPESYNFFRWADQFDSGNALVKRSVFEKTGLFDEQFNKQRMGDGEFGIRAYLHGFKSISNYKAARAHLKVETGGLREMGGWDGFRPKQWFSPKPLPSVIYMYRKYFPKTFANKALLIGTLLSNVPFKFKKSSKGLALSILFTLIKSPLLLLQYVWAKRIAAKMLQHKNGIRFLTAKPANVAAH